MPHSLESIENLWALPASMAESVLRSLFHERNAPEHAINTGLPSEMPSAMLPAVMPTAQKLYSVHNGVAVIPVTGAIARQDIRSFWTGKILAIGQDTIKAALANALQDVSVKGILLCINSPGGLVHGTKELADFIAQSVKPQKPVAAYVDGLCASAALWLGAATGRIYAPKTASVGSVGVIHMHVDYSKLYEKSGIKITPIAAGQYKAVGADSQALSDDDKAYLQEHINAIHTIFKEDVKTGLNLTQPESAWGEAQLFLAEKALGVGLVSAIVQDLDDALHIFSKENFMDKQTLAAQHPELLAELTAEIKLIAKEEAKAETLAKFKATNQEEQEALLAVVAACTGSAGMEAVKAVLEQCAAAQLSAKQIITLVPSFAPAATLASTQKDAPDAETQSRAAILSALHSTGNAALPADVKGETHVKAKKSALVADAEARAQQAQ